MRDSRGRPTTDGPADLRQEVTLTLQLASMEQWVIEEARRIDEARAVKAAWADVLRRRT